MLAHNIAPGPKGLDRDVEKKLAFTSHWGIICYGYVHRKTEQARVTIMVAHVDTILVACTQRIAPAGKADPSRKVIPFKCLY